MTLSVSPFCYEESMGGCLLRIHCVHSDSEEPVFLLDDPGLFCDGKLIAMAPQSSAERQMLREARAAVGLENEAERRRQEAAGRWGSRVVGCSRRQSVS